MGEGSGSALDTAALLARSLMHEHHRYNGTDVLATRQVLDTLLPLAERRGVLDLAAAELAMEAPLLSIARRGVLVDAEAAHETAVDLRTRVRGSVEAAELIAGTKLSGPKTFSTQKLSQFFYETELLNGVKSTDETALRQIMRRTRSTKHPRELATGVKDICAEVAEHVLEARSAGKLLSVISARRHGGRLRGSFNVGATETFRLSSSSTPMGDGTNLQNIDNRLRHFFIPSGPEWMFVGMDQERAESLCVAYFSGDPGYIRAHHEGDTHLNVAALIWPDLAQYPDLRRAYDDEDPRVVEARGISKRVQHAQNYLEPEAPPHTVARLTGMTLARSAEIMERYAAAFPGINEDKERVREEIQRTGAVEICGIRRHLHGKLSDPRTLREALSHRAQCVSTWTTNVLLARLWLDLDGPDLRVLVHEHDGILMEVRRSEWDRLRPEIEARTRIEWHLPEGRTLVIPWEIKTGNNWAEV